MDIKVSFFDVDGTIVDNHSKKNQSSDMELVPASAVEAIRLLKENGILAVFHYLSLHLSEFYKNNSYEIPTLPNCDYFADHLIRLPMFYELSNTEVNEVIIMIHKFFENR